MDWIKGFYSKTGQWWGPGEAKITSRDLGRVEIIRKLAPNATSILELGSGYGNTAAACAEAGYNVVAVEVSDRANFSSVFTEQNYQGLLNIIKDDFYKVNLEQKFDLVTYWNGFGIGEDSDQRRLLKRIAEEWLSDSGIALIDISNPFIWAEWNDDGEILTAKPDQGYNFNVSEKIMFDPINNRFIDTWWETDNPDEKISQSIRCYTPADLKLLLEGTGLSLKGIEVNGKTIDLNSRNIDQSLLEEDRHEYLAVFMK